MVTLKPLDRDAKEPYATKVGFFDDGVPAQARLIVAFKTGTALAQLLGIPPIQKRTGAGVNETHNRMHKEGKLSWAPPGSIGLLWWGLWWG